MTRLRIWAAPIAAAALLISGAATAADHRPFVKAICAEQIDHKINAAGRDMGERRFRVTIDWNGFTPAPGLMPDLVAYDASNVYYPQFRNDVMTALPSTVRFNEHGSLYPLTFAISTFTPEAQAELNRSCFHSKRGEKQRCFVKADTPGVTVYDPTISISQPTEDIICTDVKAIIGRDLPPTKFLLAIGNTEYGPDTGATGVTRSGVGARLPNAASDAADVFARFARLLAPNGGEQSVVHPSNATYDDMARSLAQYSQAVTDSPTAIKSVFFFSGHGFSLKNETYLVPIGAILPTAEEIKGMANPDIWLGARFWRLSQIVRYLHSVHTGFNLVILDICRDNPWAVQFPQDIDASAKGFIQNSKGDVVIGNGPDAVILPQNTIIAFSTAPGTPTPDGNGHSPYVARLLTELDTGRNVEDVVRSVSADPASAANGMPVPTYVGSIRADNDKPCLGTCTAARPSQAQ